MTKHDREKMYKRLSKALARKSDLLAFVAREVDRAVRAERKAWKAGEESRLRWIREADKELIDGATHFMKKRR